MAIKVTFLIRRDTAANWTTVNPVLRTGEPAIETDTRRIKYGNGVDNWNDLDYASVPMPAGGTTGQILQKFSNNNFEFTWSSLTAGIVPFTPVGTISATNVQGAIAELDAEKLGGPGASTDNAVVRWDGTGGFLVQSSGVIVDDSDNVTGVATLEVDDDVYGAGWNGSIRVPTKNAIYDKITAQDATITTKLTGAPINSSSALIPTLNPPWINYGSGLAEARYYKDACGVVHLEGVIQAPGGSPTSGVTLFTLLSGYRPPDRLIFGCWGGGGAYRLDIYPDGSVVMEGGNTAFSSLCGISFIPA